jgi:hypothetical protein
VSARREKWKQTFCSLQTALISKGCSEGFSRAGFADDVHVGAAVGLRDTKCLVLIADVRPANQRDGILATVGHASIVTMNGRVARRAF